MATFPKISRLISIGPNMSSYTDVVDWCELQDGRRYIVTRPFSWEIGKLNSGLIVNISVGTPFDVSVPLLLRFAFNPFDVRFLKAAALHDELLRRDWNRVTAAAVFNEALSAEKVSKPKRFAMWLAVSLWKWK